MSKRGGFPGGMGGFGCFSNTAFPKDVIPLGNSIPTVISLISFAVVPIKLVYKTIFPQKWCQKIDW